jgi:hypothetical protein
MAGSMTWREYRDDTGVLWSIRMDKSNAQAVVSGGSTVLCIPRSANYPVRKSTVGLRSVYTYCSTSPRLKRRFTVGDPALVAELLASGTISALIYPSGSGGATINGTWVITSYRGDRSNLAPPILGDDTGLNDGSIGQ